jgi:hypothetical protein
MGKQVVGSTTKADSVASGGGGVVYRKERKG